MSGSWSAYVIALVVLQVVSCVVLLWYTSRRHKDEAEPEKTGHVWDEDITEYNKPLPRWWINLFYLTIVFAIGYLAWYPGFGNFAGSSGWTSAKEHDAAKAEGDAKLAAALKPFEGKALPELAADPKALAFGKGVFANNCAVCHGSNAQGAVGYPNLTDASWQWGGQPEQIVETVLNGRQAAMPAWATSLTAMGGTTAKADVISYVRSLSKLEQPSADVQERGQKLFVSICAACHGPDAKGMAVLGAPDLTDDAWVYGNSHDVLMTGIDQGRNGQMPAHKPLIGETRARLAAAYVWSLSHKSEH